MLTGRFAFGLVVISTGVGFDWMLLLSVGIGEMAVVSGVLGGASVPMVVLMGITIYRRCVAATVRWSVRPQTSRSGRRVTQAFNLPAE